MSGHRYEETIAYQQKSLQLKDQRDNPKPGPGLQAVVTSLSITVLKLVARVDQQQAWIQDTDKLLGKLHRHLEQKDADIEAIYEHINHNVEIENHNTGQVKAELKHLLDTALPDSVWAATQTIYREHRDAVPVVDQLRQEYEHALQRLMTAWHAERQQQREFLESLLSRIPAPQVQVQPMLEPSVVINVPSQQIQVESILKAEPTIVHKHIRYDENSRPSEIVEEHSVLDGPTES